MPGGTGQPVRHHWGSLSYNPGAEDLNMASSGTLEHPPSMRELKWSQGEKAIARKAFERALQQELEAVMQEAMKRAAKIAQPSDLWELEHYLTERRKEIDRKYDYRYSVLPRVFGVLVREGRLTEEDLRGLGEDKLSPIRACANL